MLRAGAPELEPLHDPLREQGPARAKARAILQAHVSHDASQARTLARMLAFLDSHPDALLRSDPDGHLTASALLVDAEGERALLGLHRKLGRWLQLGGHCDGDGNLPGAALREAIEESGIPELAIAPAPIDLDIHVIPARAGEPEHLHYDTRFLVFADEHARPRVSSESVELRWFAPSELAEIETDDSVLRLFRLAFGA